MIRNNPLPKKPITIAIASGKGGTGKTTFAVNLAMVWQRSQQVLFLDCDVEAPDAHLFLKPQITSAEAVMKHLPEIDLLKCTYCGICAAACQFNAISILNNPVMPQPQALIFPDLCHDCGVCAYVCPEQAITEVDQTIGRIQSGFVTENLLFAAGELDFGQPSAAPLIHALKNKALSEEDAFDVILYDAPPGTSCAVVETIRNADLVLLVTEPTPFGIHDLKLMVQLLQQMHKPAVIIINRANIGRVEAETEIAEMGFPIIQKLPFRKEYAQTIAAGELLVEHHPETAQQFEVLTALLVTPNLQDVFR